MKLTALFTLTFASLSVAQTTTTFASSQLAAASSEALQSDETFIFDVIIDLVSRYTTYIEYMDDNGMAFPTGVANYINRLQTLSMESDISQAIATKSFPFEEFQTMMTAFPWYTSLLEEAGLSTFYMPSDFLTDGVASETSSAKSVVESAVSSLNAVLSSESSASSEFSSSSSSSSVGASTSSAASSSASSTSSAGVDALYVPVMAVPALLAAMFM